MPMRFLVAFALACVSLQARIVFDGHSTIYIGADEPGPIQKAAADLAQDCSTVFGQRVQVTHSLPAHGGPVIWIGTKNLPEGVAQPGGWEQLDVQAVPAHHALVLTGSDIRGTIYAVYQFSQEFLGVDPLYWWTDHAPAHRNSVTVADDFHESAGPRIHYRGWFVNDEDLLTGWTPGIRDGTGISLATWDRVFEALLRLKGNMVVPGTWIFPYEPQIEAAAERGLIITQHHVNVLGLDTYKWPKDQPYSFSSRPDLLEAAWRLAMSQYPKDAEVITSVNYRGQNDYPFWQIEKDAPKTD